MACRFSNLKRNSNIGFKNFENVFCKTVVIFFGLKSLIIYVCVYLCVCVGDDAKTSKLCFDEIHITVTEMMPYNEGIHIW